MQFFRLSMSFLLSFQNTSHIVESKQNVFNPIHIVMATKMVPVCVTCCLHPRLLWSALIILILLFLLLYVNSVKLLLVHDCQTLLDLHFNVSNLQESMCPSLSSGMPAYLLHGAAPPVWRWFIRCWVKCSAWIIKLPFAQRMAFLDKWGSVFLS